MTELETATAEITRLRFCLVAMVSAPDCDAAKFKTAAYRALNGASGYELNEILRHDWDVGSAKQQH